MVYHYTSIDALMHIIESIPDSEFNDAFVFKATNVLYMNDPEEFVYGRKVFIETLREIERSLEIDDKDSISCKWQGHSSEDEKELDQEYLEHLEAIKSLPYVISFTRLEDSLPVWLNYGNGGKGVCLAFTDNRSQPFKTRKTEKGEIVYESFFTSDVYYQSIPKDSELYKLMCDIINSYKKDLKDFPDMDLKESYFDSLIQNVAPFVKTIFYSNEAEIRYSNIVNKMTRVDRDVTKFRCNRFGNIIPYVDVEIPTEQLDHIIIGPIADFKLTKMALEMMTEKFMHRKVDILPSEVKYREY